VVIVQNLGDIIGKAIETASSDISELPSVDGKLQSTDLALYYEKQTKILLNYLKDNQVSINPNALNVILVALASYSMLERSLLDSQEDLLKANYKRDRKRIMTRITRVIFDQLAE
jgi:hypothetical protein